MSLYKGIPPQQTQLLGNGRQPTVQCTGELAKPRFVRLVLFRKPLRWVNNAVYRKKNSAVVSTGTLSTFRTNKDGVAVRPNSIPAPLKWTGKIAFVDDFCLCLKCKAIRVMVF
jgi:hypothetical protein